MTTKLSHDIDISGLTDYYLNQIKLGHAGERGDEGLLSHATSIESLFDSNKFITLKSEELLLCSLTILS